LSFSIAGVVPPTEALRKALGEVVVRGDFHVPPYPAVALRLQRIFAKPNYGIGEIADAIAADPALATRVLGVANSALYRAQDDITTLPRAVNRLGARVVASVALAASVGSGATQPGVLFDVKYRVWRRSVTCALAAQKLGPLRGIDANEAFVVALIHGFGRSVAVASLEQLLAAQRPAPSFTLGEWLSMAEEQRGHLALAVAERWQLPTEIVAVLRSSETTTPFGALLADATLIAAALEGASRPALSQPRELAAVEELIAGLPAALDALAAVPPPAPGRPASAVALSEQVLAGERRPSSLAVADLRKHGAARLACVSIAPTGLCLESSAALQESSMVRLAVGSDSERFETWFNVLLCAPAQNGCRVEVELFSPSKEMKERFIKLFASAGASAPHAPL
jgi:HD-like signal output (HDOD) protein